MSPRPGDALAGAGGPGYTASAMTDRSSPLTTAAANAATPTDSDDPILTRALEAVGRTRALGLHFYGHFIGIGGSQAHAGKAHLTVDGEPAGYGAAGVSAAALATVADLAIGGAIRSHLEKGARLATATLSVQHPTAPAAGPVAALADAEPTSGDCRAGRCALVAADGQIVGYAQGWFAPLPPPPGWVQRPMPWEYDEPPTVAVPSVSELTERERAAVAAARAAGERACRRGTSISEELLHFHWQPAVEGHASGELAVGPELANRVGHIQGGALYGAAAIVAAQAVGVSTGALADGHYQFLRPGDGDLMHGEATVLRRGRLAAFVESRLSVDGKLVGIGLFSFRMSPADLVDAPRER